MFDLRRGLWVTFGLSILAFVSHFWPSPAQERVVFLQVGQGDCTLIQGEGCNVLIDAGPRSPRFDAGSQVIARELRRLGVRQIDMILLSHPDMDHIGGLPGLSRRMPIRLVFATNTHLDHYATREIVMRSRLEAKTVFGEDRGRMRCGSFEIEWVTPRWAWARDDNDGSMFVRVRDDHGAIVFTGDASSEVEEEMMEQLDWPADVLKAGHHGSGTSTGQRWLMDTRPKWVVVSCGRYNAYGHPHPATLKRIESVGAEALRTDQLGNLVFIPTPQGFVFQRAMRRH